MLNIIQFQLTKNHLFFDSPDDIWREYYGDTNSLTKYRIDENITFTDHILVFHVYFINLDDPVLNISENPNNKVFVYNTIFDTIQNGENYQSGCVYQEKGQCVQYKICNINLITSFTSYMSMKTTIS